jgi:hypothetical protein
VAFISIKNSCKSDSYRIGNDEDSVTNVIAIEEKQSQLRKIVFYNLRLLRSSQ